MSSINNTSVFLKIRNTSVISNDCEISFLAKVAAAPRKQYQEKQARSGWLVLESDSWIKGTENAVKYCKENKLKYELVSGLTHEEMLQKMSSEGLGSMNSQ